MNVPTHIQSKSRSDKLEEKQRIISLLRGTGNDDRRLVLFWNCRAIMYKYKKTSSYLEDGINASTIKINYIINDQLAILPKLKSD